MVFSFILKVINRVVGLYLVLSITILPFNMDGLWMIALCGVILAAFLLFYGKEHAIEILLSGWIVSLFLTFLLPFLWRKYYRIILLMISGYFLLQFPSPNLKRKNEVEENLKTVIDE